MFRGTHPDLGRAVGRALAAARELGHPRAGSEHLLLALTTGTVGSVLGRHGVTAAAVRAAVGRAAPLGAGAAADRDALAPFGIDLDRLGLTPAVLDRAPAREPLLPFGAAEARRWCASMRPPLGLDAQAAFEASLRLALARRERDHRPEHLALVLVALDPGAAWVLADIDADPGTLLADLAEAFPPPRRNALLRADRRIGRRSRGGDLIRRYQRTTGRVVREAGAVPALIGG
ncbi:Clp protease N-terminal domain-containing protein [Dactylosporangium sucinum]|uniref:Peptidase n=1 Tax=Dactylosporangium sucinum TaxID=1424081 RepID=A0A917X6B0_9ACTN|nr:Clp protease N-terminal domain-containing protein [Dactylosporangium sucinum]GGM77079.1 peptidase [Dactylosporangium sucinum]